MSVLLAVVLTLSSVAVYAACPSGCKKACCSKTESKQGCQAEKKEGCHKADPNSK